MVIYMQYKILVCDDDEDIVSALEIYLKGENYDVIKASNGQEAVSQCIQKEPHLILLDIMMPVMDGIQAAVKIRETSNVPILFLSAKSEDTDRIFGLNIGGDDYITKPFNPIELLARVRAHLRRYARLGSMPHIQQDVYNTGGLTLDDSKKMVTIDDDPVALTAIEYNILKLLMQNMEQVFSSSQIYEQVWNEPAFDIGKTVSVHIRHIREKIEINAKEPEYVKVIYGLGYKVVKIRR